LAYSQVTNKIKFCEYASRSCNNGGKIEFKTRQKMLIVFQILTLGKNLKWPNFDINDLVNCGSTLAEQSHLLPMFKGSSPATPRQVFCSIMVIKSCIVQNPEAGSKTLIFCIGYEWA
jgi:hypothetical protein